MNVAPKQALTLIPKCFLPGALEILPTSLDLCLIWGRDLKLAYTKI